MGRGPGTLRTIMIVLGSTWFTFLLNILRVLVLPTKLGDDGLGQVTLAISFTTFFGIFTSLGASTYLVRAIAQDPPAAHRYLSNAFALRVVMAGAVLALLMGIANLFGYSAETLQVILIVGVYMVISTISNVFESGLQGLGQMGWRAIAQAAGQITITLAGVSLLLLGADAVTYALVMPVGMALQLAVVLAYYALKHPIRWSVDPAVMRNLLIGGLPLFIWGFLQTAYGQIDATLLSLFADVHVVGWFGAAAQITNVLIIVPSAISAVALPVLCELYVKDSQAFDRAATRTLVTTLLLAAPIGAGLAISASDVLHLLPYPAEFQHAAPVLALLALALPVTGVLMVLSTLAVAIGQERQWIKISLFAVVIFPPLYMSMIAWFQRTLGNGAQGVGVANLIGESALVVWAWIVLPRQLRQPAVVQQGVRIAALALVMVAVVALLQQGGVPLPAYAPIGAVIYGGGAWLLRLVTPADLQIVRRALGRRSRRAPAASEV